MVNTEKLLACVEAAGTTWERIVADIEGLPEDLAVSVDRFEHEVNVSTVARLIEYLGIPTADVDGIFFAPSMPKTPEDVIADCMRGMHKALKEEGAELFRIFSTLGVRERHDLMSAAFELEEKAGAAGRTAAE